ncbi:MAG: Cu2+-containing amine oxidase [Rubrobacteraceae bacterium]|nr:Cu2+-containing amine oxidase [Rubrobacteraceae bacterium]
MGQSTGRTEWSAAVRHPLDPLTAAELRQAADILRREKDMSERWRFASIELKEPVKEALRGFAPEDPIAREAVLVCCEGRVVSWEHCPGEQPNITVDEFHECDEALREDPRVAEALAVRGITNLDRVLFDTWAYGASLISEEYRGMRVGWADVWYRTAEDSNPYANPVNGLHFVVDLNRMELLEVEDDFTVEKPQIMGEYLPKHVPSLVQRDLKPLEITQPEGTSFILDGHELRWQKWSMRLGFNYREGLVLYCVGYEDGGRVRKIAHRMSFAEMVVPYRDPNPDHYRRTAFDIGEWGLGFMTTSLELATSPRGSSHPTAISWTNAPTRRSTSTSSWPASTLTSTDRTTPYTCPSPKPCLSVRTTRTVSRSCKGTRRCARRKKASKTTTGTPSVPGRW